MNPFVMAMFEVYLPENQTDGNAVTERGIADARFLGERASIFALILPAIWLIWHRLWWALAGYLLFAFAIAGLGMTQWAPATMAFTLLPGIYFLLEGPNWIADKWQREGYVLAGLVEADNKSDAELRWIARQNPENLLNMQRKILPNPAYNPSSPPVWSNQKEDRAEFGLFAED